MSASIDVSAISCFLAQHTGLDLGRGGMEARLVSHIQQRLAERALSFPLYLEEIKTPDSEELRLLSEAMTVVYTWFFRDPGQFALIEGLISDFPPSRAMHVWIAGCATGEEAYSVALVAARLGRRIEVLGTDINSNAIYHAQQGRYSASSLNAVDPVLRKRYLDCPGEYEVPASIKACVRFQNGNLIEGAPQAPTPIGWDLVVCRNVLIYFGKDQATRTLDVLANSLAPGGALVLGASEAIIERPTMLNVAAVAGRAVLVRPKPNESPTRASGIQTPIRTWEAGAPRVPVRHRHSKAGSPCSPKAPRTSAYSDTYALEATRETQPDARRVREAIEAGHRSLESGDIPGALSWYLDAAKWDPTCPEALMHSGIAHYLQGSFSEALYQLRGALCLDPQLWPAHFFQALSYENMGYAEDAARSYAQVVKLNATDKPTMCDHPLLKGWRNDLLAVASSRAGLTSSTQHGHENRAQRRP